MVHFGGEATEEDKPIFGWNVLGRVFKIRSLMAWYSSEGQWSSGGAGSELLLLTVSELGLTEVFDKV